MLEDTETGMNKSCGGILIMYTTEYTEFNIKVLWLDFQILLLEYYQYCYKLFFKIRAIILLTLVTVLCASGH